MIGQAVEGSSFEVVDVVGKLVVFTYEAGETPEKIEGFIAALQQTADNLKEAGAINVIVLASDITLNTLDEQQLTVMGLQIKE
jgi:hypothetical protein